MEGRPKRGRGATWRLGSENETDSSASKYRNRGRGRGKKDNSRGRGGGISEAGFHQRGQDEENNLPLENDSMKVFSKRKLESNWDRYKESEREERADDVPTHRGTDYHVLLESAGNSFTQFRFSEEKEWEADSLIVNQISAMFVGLPELAQILQEFPVHQRLNLQAELVQRQNTFFLSTPVELPTIIMAPKQYREDTALKGHNAGPAPQLSCAKSLVDDSDELDQLLSLQKIDAPIDQCFNAGDENPAVPEKRPEETEATLPSKIVLVKQEMSEKDLEDWLDSMIS